MLGGKAHQCAGGLVIGAIADEAPVGFRIEQSGLGQGLEVEGQGGSGHAQLLGDIAGAGAFLTKFAEQAIDPQAGLLAQH